MAVLRIHKEGRKLLLALLISLGLLSALAYLYLPGWFMGVALLCLIFFLLILQFFRDPVRPIPLEDAQLIYAPADGKVVVIEQTEEKEYFQDRRLQLSIFMSPFNVHVNRSPMAGEVKYYRYHPGKYLVAWHPKSSTENERTTTVLANQKGQEILLRQIAGALAKRIVNYLQPGQQVAQGSEIGFIKFGSRVDVFLPTDAEILVDINQPVLGNITPIAKLP